MHILEITIFIPGLKIGFIYILNWKVHHVFAKKLLGGYIVLILHYNLQGELSIIIFFLILFGTWSIRDALSLSEYFDEKTIFVY